MLGTLCSPKRQIVVLFLQISVISRLVWLVYLFIFPQKRLTEVDLGIKNEI